MLDPLQTIKGVCSDYQPSVHEYTHTQPACVLYDLRCFRLVYILFFVMILRIRFMWGRNKRKLSNYFLKFARWYRRIEAASCPSLLKKWSERKPQTVKSCRWNLKRRRKHRTKHRAEGRLAMILSRRSEISLEMRLESSCSTGWNLSLASCSVALMTKQHFNKTYTSISKQFLCIVGFYPRCNGIVWYKHALSSWQICRIC
jgi:hypothetical protein